MENLPTGLLVLAIIVLVISIPVFIKKFKELDELETNIHFDFRQEDKNEI